MNRAPDPFRWSLMECLVMGLATFILAFVATIQFANHIWGSHDQRCSAFARR